MRVCVQCGVRIRRHRLAQAMAPGTQTLGGRGMCQCCYRRVKRAEGSAVPADISPGFDERLAARALECFLVERRARLARKVSA
jgi:hypothetical protein